MYFTRMINQKFLTSRPDSLCTTPLAIIAEHMNPEEDEAAAEHMNPEEAEAAAEHMTPEEEDEGGKKHVTLRGGMTENKKAENSDVLGQLLGGMEDGMF